MKWLGLLLAASVAHADPLPVDPRIVTGTLANGVRYAIGHADVPKLEIVVGTEVLSTNEGIDKLHAMAKPGKSLVVLAVVNGDPVVAQRAIEKTFSDLPKVPALVPTGTPVLARGTVVADVSPARIGISFGHAIAPRDTEAHLRAFLRFQLASVALNRRARALPCDHAMAAIWKGSLQMMCELTKDGVATLDTIAHVVGDVRKHGFTDAELAVARDVIGNAKQKPDALSDLEQWFLDGDVPMAPDARVALINKLLAGIRADEVATEFRALGVPSIFITGGVKLTAREVDARFAAEVAK